MKNENTNFPKEKELLNVLLNTCSDARRCYLKYEVLGNIMSLLTIDEDRSDGSKWDSLMRLQKRINIVKFDLGVNDAEVLMQDVIETISEYLNNNYDFKKEAVKNVKILTNIQIKKEKTMEQIFRKDAD